MLIPREGSLLLAASGSLRIACEPTAVNLAWNLIFGINHQWWAHFAFTPIKHYANHPPQKDRGFARGGHVAVDCQFKIN
jgi:hypothetical protein